MRGGGRPGYSRTSSSHLMMLKSGSSCERRRFLLLRRQRSRSSYLRCMGHAPGAMAPAQLTASVLSAFNAVMAGIVSYGSYVPYRRLKRSAIAAVLGTPSRKGERAIASFDEDSVSMAVEATRDPLKAAPPGGVPALLFATTTPPYAAKP